jgi:hypothetical protein
MTGNVYSPKPARTAAGKEEEKKRVKESMKY